MRRKPANLLIRCTSDNSDEIVGIKNNSYGTLTRVKSKTCFKINHRALRVTEIVSSQYKFNDKIDKTKDVPLILISYGGLFIVDGNSRMFYRHSAGIDWSYCIILEYFDRDKIYVDKGYKYPINIKLWLKNKITFLELKRRAKKRHLRVCKYISDNNYEKCKSL